MSLLVKLKVAHFHNGRKYMPGQLCRVPNSLALAMDGGTLQNAAPPAEVVKEKAAARAAKADHDDKAAKKAAKSK